MREMISNRCEPRARSSSLPVARVHRWEDSFILRRLLITRYHPKGGSALWWIPRVLCLKWEFPDDVSSSYEPGRRTEGEQWRARQMA